MARNGLCKIMLRNSSKTSCTLNAMQEMGTTCFIAESNACITGLVRVAEAQDREAKDEAELILCQREGFRLHQGVGMGGSRNIRANRHLHHVPKAAKHAATDDEMSSPFFFFWRNTTTNGTTSFGAPSPITLGRIFFDTLAFALPTLEPFLEL
jgi:hypothetical protein